MKRIAAFILAVFIAVGTTSCKPDEGTDAIPQVSTVAPLSVSASDTETSVSDSAVAENNSDENVFDDGYDPFAEDYNPYGDETPAVTSEDTVAATTAQTTQTSQTTEPTQAETPRAVKETAAQTSPTQTQATQTTVQTEKPKPADKNAAKGNALYLNVPNSWQGNDGEYIQLDGTVYNGTSAQLSGWSAEIAVKKGAVISQSWNCTPVIKGDKITVTPVDYNSSVAPGGNVTFGMIIRDAGKFKADASKLKTASGSVPAIGKEFKQGSGGSSGNVNGDNNTNNNSGGGQAKVSALAKNVPAPTTDDWLSVRGNKIVDANGKEVWLTGLNWFGYNTGTNTFDGLWNSNLNASIISIADHGFNVIRVPFSAELINNWAAGSYPTANFNHADNDYLVGMNSLEIFDYFIGQCRANGIKVIIDIHCAKTDASGHMKPMWYDGNVTEKDYLAALSWMAQRYSKDDTIIAYDLKNEPHGKPNESPRAIWNGSKSADNWKNTAEKAAKAVLDKNPNALVLVEGIEIYPKDIKKNASYASQDTNDYYFNWWGGNLRGVKDFPVNLGKHQNKLVYSPHDYGPSVYRQPWFDKDYTYESLYKDVWHDNWLYIYENGTAPLLIGEWGGFMREPNLTWMTYMRQLIKKYRLNHTFWCYNANSGDTGGLVLDDFKTWDNEKYAFVKEVLWQQNGKFVGLDHKIPLGENGITLAEAK